MCGILGLIGAPSAPEAFGQALDLLAHRGPDDRGIHAGDNALLGHRRLSILDLSAAGHQPMVDADSGTVIVFNGEIYNYIELRQELEGAGYRFHSQTDTEVLLRAWLHWGADCLHRLNGMWAFAIWQPVKQKLFIARDRFGVKPFYYTTQDGGFCFASEPKAILRLRPNCKKVNSRVLAEFLCWGKLYSGDASFYESVSILRAAHCGEYSVASQTLRIWRYWDYPHGDEVASDAKRDIETFAALLDDAVRLRLRSDVAVGITLSGGLDSTAILASAAANSTRSLPCFTAVYGDDRGEVNWARVATAPYGLKPIEVEASKADWTALLQQIAWHMDGPGYSPAVFPLWQIMKHAHEDGVPVLLEGQGADEALAGYPHYFAVAIWQQFVNASLRPNRANLCELRALLKGASRTFSPRWTLMWLARELLPSLTGPYRRRVGAGETLRSEYRLPLHEASAQRRSGRYADKVNNRLWADHSSAILPGLLQYGDAVSMAHSVESRLPFMDYRLVEWLFSRGSDIKLGHGQSKRILRSYLHRIGQQSIAERADKRGFPTPAERWLSEDNGAILREALLQTDSRLAEFCEPARMRRLVDAHCAGRGGTGNHLYRLLSSELWMRESLR